MVTRGNPLMEEILNRGLPYVSGPQWLAEHVLRGHWVLAVAGTHGKTTTTRCWRGYSNMPASIPVS